MAPRAHQILFGYIQTQTLHAVVKLGVADALDEGPRSAEALGAQLDADPRSLGRAIDVLIKLGLFTRTEDGLYAHNDESRCLSSRHDNSLADLLLFCARESYQTFGHLPDAVKHNKAVFEQAWGIPFWQHLNDNPDRRTRFARAMERQSETLLTGLASRFDFAAYPSITDVGGGKGQLFRPLARAGVRAESVVFDLPKLAGTAQTFLSDEGLEHVRFIGGDFFEGVPAGADLYILKFVLHDWADAECDAILKQVRAAMKPTSKLMIIELFRGGDPSPWSYLSDMLMLSTFGAGERSEEEYRAMLGRAGFEVDAVEHIHGAHFFVMATP